MSDKVVATVSTVETARNVLEERSMARRLAAHLQISIVGLLERRLSALSKQRGQRETDQEACRHAPDEPGLPPAGWVAVALERCPRREHPNAREPEGRAEHEPTRRDVRSMRREARSEEETRATEQKGR